MINKKYSPKGKSCKVTFELPADVATDQVAVLGEFNNWNTEENTMKLRKKDGKWACTVALKPGNTYQFRYLADGQNWLNEEKADGFEANVFGSQNSVIEL